jgi:membrane protein implicated in regulation of membrane protease activity
MTRRRWGWPEQPLPKHPYRDTVLVYGGMAIVLVLLAWATGGSLQRAAVVAVVFFAIATLWSWSRWRRRLRDAERAQDAVR